MKNFQLSKNLLNSRGQFYPTGHILALFPSADAAQAAARALADAGLAEVSLITPEVMQRDIARTAGEPGALPSAGTEADTLLRFADYASKGHHALLIPAPDGRDNDRVMRALADHAPSHAQRYDKLIIEDLA
jgi:hypothetical protein